MAFPHMGSWELPGRAMLLRGMPVLSVAGKQKNPLFDRYLNSTRERMGVPIIMRGTSALKTIVSRLKQGGFLALLPDVRMPAEGVRVRFLGGEANVGAGMAMFARHAGVPIYPVIMRRIGWARHEARIFEPVRSDPALDKPADIRRMTQHVLDIVDRAIRDDPGQWFWYNKRWILDPVESVSSV
jgi:KDO2-lipid IV(A) lauroyltransferase